MTNRTPELCEFKPEEFTMVNSNTYIQRKDIHEVGYNSLDGNQTFIGYECYSREISKEEFNKLNTNQIY